jgi:hypothetical protein
MLGQNHFAEPKRHVLTLCQHPKFIVHCTSGVALRLMWSHQPNGKRPQMYFLLLSLMMMFKGLITRTEVEASCSFCQNKICSTWGGGVGVPWLETLTKWVQQLLVTQSSKVSATKSIYNDKDPWVLSGIGLMMDLPGLLLSTFKSSTIEAKAANPLRLPNL